MTDEKPVDLMWSPLSRRWYAVLRRDGRTIKVKRPLTDESARQLDEMRDAYDWLTTLMDATGQSREEIAAAFDVTIKERR